MSHTADTPQAKYENVTFRMGGRNVTMLVAAKNDAAAAALASLNDRLAGGATTVGLVMPSVPTRDGMTARQPSRSVRITPSDRPATAWLEHPAFAGVRIVSPLGWTSKTGGRLHGAALASAMGRRIGFDEFRLRMAESVIEMAPGVTTI